MTTKLDKQGQAPSKAANQPSYHRNKRGILVGQEVF